ncbi:MAG: DMT family transporter [Promethearchaeota archaeon]|nr:MAG: DMT family transporter [Candidatus Lokiarchaeota archaeon]
MNKKNSYLLAVITMIFWGTAFAFSKVIIDQGIHPVVFLALRMSFAFFFLLVYLLLLNQLRPWFQMFKRHFWRLAVLGVVLYAISYLIQYIGVQYTTAINQTVISNTSTFFVVIFNYILYRRKPSKVFFASMIVGFVGVLFIILDEGFQLTSTTILGDLLTLLSFFLWGLYVVLNRSITINENPLYVTFSVFLWTTVSLVPLSFGFDIIHQIELLNWTHWGIIAYLGIICSGLATLLYTIALANKNIPSENLALISFLLPVVGIITSILVLNEGFSWQDLIGCSLVLISVFIVEGKQKPEPDVGHQVETVH